jgi:hypothetical protein
MSNFIQIKFAKRRMFDLPSAGSKRPGCPLSYLIGPFGCPLLAPKLVERKEISMEMPSILQGDSLTRLLQGAFAGFVATVVIGFGWGGWTLGSTAKQMADKNASAAVVAVLAPMCADKFRQGADASANMVELKKVSSWMQDSYIEKGGWATFPGNASPDRSVAQACATLLTTLQ